MTLPPADIHELLVSDALTPGMFDGRFSEHLIAGASDSYVAQRAQIARRYLRLGEPRSLDASQRAARWAELGWFPR